MWIEVYEWNPTSDTCYTLGGPSPVALEQFQLNRSYRWADPDFQTGATELGNQPFGEYGHLNLISPPRFLDTLKVTCSAGRYLSRLKTCFSELQELWGQFCKGTTLRISSKFEISNFVCLFGNRPRNTLLSRASRGGPKTSCYGSRSEKSEFQVPENKQFYRKSKNCDFRADQCFQKPLTS